MILITGCARSGTKYCAAGWGLSHEGKADPKRGIAANDVSMGLSSWLMGARYQEGFALPAPQAHGVVPDGWEPDVVIHVVRYPLRAISSALVMRHGWLAWAQQYVDIGYPRSGLMPYTVWNDKPMVSGNEHVRVVTRYWIGWNKLCFNSWAGPSAGYGRLQRVEELDFPGVSKTTNHRKHRELTWDELREALGDGLYGQLVLNMRNYGYSPHEEPGKGAAFRCC